MALAFYPEERGLASLNSNGSALPGGYCPRENLNLSSASHFGLTGSVGIQLLQPSMAMSKVKKKSRALV